ncbi:hypothetical protein LRS10_11745 [Phenylobacterium sp. J426]|uniref:hypothetical protein n=1 Tax=Phenylobacterium sp. J426 TaxID=2898439 RepID=UPI002151DD0E|nr:hypothetical protein [Phenylobacterium sp. J426]MCR5874780.1 hypothetical protein [Phenylobacterium sp. J426]
MRNAASYLKLAEEAEAEAGRVDWQANRRRYLELAGIWRRKAAELVQAPAQAA